MKKVYTVALLFLLSLLLYIAQGGSSIVSIPEFNQKENYSDGLLNSEIKNVINIANYFFDVEFDPYKKEIIVDEKIIWHNKTEFPTKEIQFHLYPNAYKSNNTLFAKGYNITSSAAKTELNFTKIEVNGKSADIIFIHPENSIISDSTVAKIVLDEVAATNDSVVIDFKYTLKIPESIKRFGYARGRNFFFISQWFPKVGVFENGRWICSPYYPYLNFYSDFGFYSAKIKVPNNYVVAATGVQTQKVDTLNSSIYLFTQNGVHDFVFLASEELLQRKDVFTRVDKSQIIINAYLQPEREYYFDRYIDCVKNSLKFFEENVGVYPYQSISIVDVPRTSGSGGMEYPTLFTVSADLFSPMETGLPEYLIAHEFSHQFFHGILANNETYEAWLDEGFASYIATKIMYKYYPNILSTFKIASHIPVFGLEFFSYNEIPIIYTLADINISEGTRSLTSYYRSTNLGSLADTSYKLPTRLAYNVNSYSKAELVLHTLERYLGYEKMMSILKQYFMRFKFKHPTAKDFISLVQKNSNEDMTWFFEDFYNSSKTFDYRISYLKQISADEYEVLAERINDGFFKNDVVLHTDKEALIRKWDTNEQWKIFRFKTPHKVIAAEIDPQRKNLLDLNFANNSYTVEKRVWAPWSLTIRVLFWVQNALMILGSIG
jgi:hypothetical protein